MDQLRRVLAVALSSSLALGPAAAQAADMGGRAAPAGAAAARMAAPGPRTLSTLGSLNRPAVTQALAARGWTAERLSAVEPEAALADPELRAAVAQAAEDLSAQGALEDLQALQGAYPTEEVRAAVEAAVLGKARASAKSLGEQPVESGDGIALTSRFQALLGTVRDPALLNTHKSAAVDAFFRAIDRSLQKGKTIDLEPGKENAEFGKAWASVKDKLPKKLTKEQQRLFVELLRDFVRIEQPKLFAALTPAEGPAPRIEAAAALAKDGTFLVNQASAMIGLVSATNSIGRDAFKTVDKADGAAGLKGNRDIDALQRRFFDDYVPKVLSSVDKLGPFYTKLLQTIGTFVSMFSDKTSEAFKHLNNQLSRHMSIQQVHDAVERDLGMPVSEAFVEFDPVPFASASIAQVHRAKIRTRSGELRRVVVKVLKQSVVDELAWNLRVNQAVMRYFKTLTGDPFFIDLLAGQVDEFGKTFQAETDFRAEAERLIRWRALFRFDKGISVPRVYRRLSGASVITMDEVLDADGSNFSAELAQLQMSAPAAEKAKEETPAPAEPAAAAKTAPVEDSVDEPETAADTAPEEDAPVVRSKAAEAERAAAKVDAKSDAKKKPEGMDNILEASKDVLVAVMKTHGYRFGPQYFQVIRSFLPYLAISYNASKQAKEIDAASLNEADKARLEQIKRNIKSYDAAYWAQVLYFGEVHADMHPANVLHAGDTLHLIDFGNVVGTRGLIWRPLSLFLSLAKGDARGVEKVLGRMGKFDAKTERAAVVASIQAILDKHSIGRTSTWGLVKSMRPEKKKRTEPVKKKKAPVEPEPVEPSAPVARDENKAPVGGPGDVAGEIGGSEKTEEAGAPPADEDKPQPKAAEKKSAAGPIIAAALKEAVKFPVRWAKYKVLSVIDQAGRFIATGRLRP